MSMCLSAQHVRRASQRDLKLRTNRSESELKWQRDSAEIKTGEHAVSLTFCFHGRKSVDRGS